MRIKIDSHFHIGYNYNWENYQKYIQNRGNLEKSCENKMHKI